MGGKADFIVSYDKDLLALGKPFGVEVIRPLAFLKRLEG
jgi:predicted nucleic acid-binding protein